MAVLDTYAPEKHSLLSSLEGKKLIGKDEFNQIISDKQQVISDANELVALNKEIAENKANILKLSN